MGCYLRVFYAVLRAWLVTQRSQPVQPEAERLKHTLIASTHMISPCTAACKGGNTAAYCDKTLRALEKLLKADVSTGSGVRVVGAVAIAPELEAPGIPGGSELKEGTGEMAPDAAALGSSRVTCELSTEA
jgi:hypothetical protein